RHRRHPAKFDTEIATFPPSKFRKRIVKHSEPRLCRWIALRGANQSADQSPPGLLRVRRDWPRGRRAAEERDELAAVHSITSSAAASNFSGTVRPSIPAV